MSSRCASEQRAYGEGQRRKRRPEEDLRPQKQEDVHNDRQDLSHVAESYCALASRSASATLIVLMEI